MNILKRDIFDSILKRLYDKSSNKIIIIYGARQVGKTTLVKQLLSHSKLKAEYFNCDYLDVQSMFSYENAGNLEGLIKNYNLIILDEAQRISNIGMVLKILHDEFPKLKIIATGSSSFELSNMINEPLTGRKIVYQLYPFTYNELTLNHTAIKAKREINRILRFGSYPAVILNDDLMALENLNEITSSYLFKDILEYNSLKKPNVLSNLLKLLSFQISNEVSYTELANKLRVDQTVVQRYIQLLEDSFIIFRLSAFKRNLRNEIGKSRKIYFWDLGVRNAIIQNVNTLDLRDDVGALWENFCIAEREKFLNYNQPRLSNTYFWRTYNKKEIDLIEETGDSYYAIEFKWKPGKQAKIPADFKNTYPNTVFKTITPDNFASEIYRKNSLTQK